MVGDACCAKLLCSRPTLPGNASRGGFTFTITAVLQGGIHSFHVIYIY